MAALNKILNILILLLAAVALVFGILLANKRTQLRSHSDQLGQTLEQVVANIAPDSDLPNKVKYNNGEGSLGFANVDQLEGLSRDINDHATALVKQRDALGGAVADVATKFNVMDEAQATDFQSLATYQEKLEALNSNVDAINQRNNDFISTLSSIGSTVNAPADEATLTDPESYEAPLNRITTGVESLADRNTAYLDALESVVARLGEDALGVTPAQIRDPETFEKAVLDMENGLRTVANNLAEFEANQRTIDELNKQVENLEDRLGEEQETVAILKGKAEELSGDLELKTTQIADMAKEIDRLKGPDGPGAGFLKGKVVEVNYDWNYAIIDLGSEDGLPTNLTMTVGRDREFIANVVVSKVYRDYAVAEIKRENKQGEVLEGDRVFYVSGPLTAN